MNNNDLPKFAINLKRIRNNRNLSQQDLAELSKVSRQSIGAYEKGIRRPKIDATKRLAAALNVAPGDIDPYGIYETPSDPTLQESLKETGEAYTASDAWKLDPEAEEILQRRAKAKGMTPGEYLSYLISRLGDLLDNL